MPSSGYWFQLRRTSLVKKSCSPYIHSSHMLFATSKYSISIYSGDVWGIYISVNRACFAASWAQKLSAEWRSSAKMSLLSTAVVGMCGWPYMAWSTTCQISCMSIRVVGSLDELWLIAIKDPFGSLDIRFTIAGGCSWKGCFCWVWGLLNVVSMWHTLIARMKTDCVRMHCIQMQLAKKKSWNSKEYLQGQRIRWAALGFFICADTPRI